MKINIVSRSVSTGVAIMGLCMAFGCATTDTVSSRFPQLEDNINAAKAADAGVYAPDPLASAEAKFESAKLALAANDMIAAHKFVDEAKVDADYARAKAPTVKARIYAIKLRKALQTVSDEIRKMPAVR